MALRDDALRALEQSFPTAIVCATGRLPPGQRHRGRRAQRRDRLDQRDAWRSGGRRGSHLGPCSSSLLRRARRRSSAGSPRSDAGAPAAWLHARATRSEAPLDSERLARWIRVRAIERLTEEVPESARADPPRASRAADVGPRTLTWTNGPTSVSFSASGAFLASGTPRKETKHEANSRDLRPDGRRRAQRGRRERDSRFTTARTKVRPRTTQAPIVTPGGGDDESGDNSGDNSGGNG